MAEPADHGSSKLLAALAMMNSALDDALAAKPSRESGDQVLTALRELESLRNRSAALDHALVLDVEQRSLPHELGARSTGALLQRMLRISGAEASARVAGAHAAGTRTGLTGEHLPPVYAAVAAAQAEGVISPRHADVIVRCVDRLPDDVQAAQGEQIEQDLVEHAADFDPSGLARIAHRINFLYDQDGCDPEHRTRNRGLTRTSRIDGSGTTTIHETAELGALLDVVLDAYGAPQPQVDGTRDPRTAPQRQHDALIQALQVAIRSGQLPSVNGVLATVVIHMSDDAWRTRRGLAVTSHGALVPTDEAMRWAGGDARVLGVGLTSAREITAYGDTHRIATERQRLAVAARDVGCSFPGCTAPAAWCQVHHMIEWQDGGRTGVDNLTLVCAHDHRERIAQGWTARMIDGRPAWIPPPWLDPLQRPRQNRAHEPATV